MKSAILRFLAGLFFCLAVAGLTACTGSGGQSEPTTVPPTAAPATPTVQPPTPTAEPEGQPFTSERFGYSFLFPAGWIIKDRPGEWPEFDTLDPNRTGGINAFAAYINNRNLVIGIGARSLVDVETLEAWVERAKFLIKEGVSKGVCNEGIEDDPVSETPITLDDEPAVMLEYVCPNRFDKFGLVVLSIHNGQGYWITWLSDQGEEAADREEFRRILGTFSFVR